MNDDYEWFVDYLTNRKHFNTIIQVVIIRFWCATRQCLGAVVVSNLCK